MAERKVLNFSTAPVEEMIRGVTEGELQKIIEIGYVLGAVIGRITFANATLRSRWGSEASTTDLGGE